MHTRLILMEQLYANFISYFEQLAQTGRLVAMKLAEDRKRQSLIERGIATWMGYGRGGV